MKKFIAAILCAVMVMMCGAAVAEETVIITASFFLGNEGVNTGKVSMVTSVCDGEASFPNNSLFGIVFPDEGGYVLEYKDENGDCYSWYDFEADYESSARTIIALIAGIYDSNALDYGIFVVSGGGSATITSISSPDDKVYDNSTDFIECCEGLSKMQ